MHLLRVPYKRLITFLTVSAIGMCSQFAHAEPDITVRYVPLAVTANSPVSNLSISADARYAAYLMIDNSSKIVVHDLTNNTLVQANLRPDGSPAVGGSCDGTAISANGRYAVFVCDTVSMAAPTAPGGRSYFVYDRINNKAEAVPVTTSGAIIPSLVPGVSADGRYIAYRTVIGTTYRLFVRDTVNKTTVSTNAAFTNLGLVSTAIYTSDDGRYVGYSGFGTAVATAQGVSVYDTVSGATEVINVNPAGVPSNKVVNMLSMSANGNVVAFQSTDVNLVTPAAPSTGVFVRDRQAGKTEFISAGAAVANGYNVSVSRNGRYVAYIGTHDSSISELYVYDRLTKTTRLVPGAFLGLLNASAPRFSEDGRYLVFHSVHSTSKAHSIGIADLGVAAGVVLSANTLSLSEGGAAATYTLSLTQAPTANVVVNITPDKQLSVERGQLTFTPQNWNVPQVVSVRAIDDGVPEGVHTGTLTNIVSSADVNYSVLSPTTVTATITDGVIPTLVLPGATWNRVEVPLTGTAAPNATVMITASNRDTGWFTSVSTVADAEGKWSHTISGLSNGVIDFDVQADAIHGVRRTLTVTLPQLSDVTSSIVTTAYGLAYNRSTGKYSGNFVLTNAGSAPLSGPLHLELANLTPGVTLDNASGSHDGAPYISTAGGLAPGASVTVTLIFNNPSRGEIGYYAKILNGTF